jgi:hypothetical protein
VASKRPEPRASGPEKSNRRDLRRRAIAWVFVLLMLLSTFGALAYYLIRG